MVAVLVQEMSPKPLVCFSLNGADADETGLFDGLLLWGFQVPGQTL